MKKIIIFATLALLILGGLYVAGKNKVETPGNTNTLKQSSIPKFSPTETVKMYMRATLGTIPGALLDYTLAKTLVTGEMKTKFNEHEFIPQSYGIQQGPDDIEFVSEKVTGNTSTVKVWGFWGDDVGMDWTFNLVNKDSQWLIVSIDVVVPDMRQ